jgi:hypothetical protein
MSRHLHPVEEGVAATRVNTREEITAWIAEREAVLAALVEAEGLGQPDQLSLVDAAERQAA